MIRVCYFCIFIFLWFLLCSKYIYIFFLLIGGEVLFGGLYKVGGGVYFDVFSDR